MTRRIIAIVDDMFFASKIRATAEAIGVDVNFPRTHEAAVELMRTSPPAIIVVDLHNHRFDPIEFVKTLKAEAGLETIPVIGFFSHVESELQRQALASGFDSVVPRSVFSRDLGTILGGSGSGC